MAVRQRNDGLRKRCGCPRRRWGECAHPWHVNFKWKGKHCRLSLDRESGKQIRSRSDARIEIDRIRAAVRAGTFVQAPDESQVRGELTFSQFFFRPPLRFSTPSLSRCSRRRAGSGSSCRSSGETSIWTGAN